MHNKKNITIMILLIMLSFAIISEVSAVDVAEADGTGLNPAINSVNMTAHDFAGESNNKLMQDHINDGADDFKSHNEQESFNNTPKDLGDRNETLYKHEMDSRFEDNRSTEFNEDMKFDYNDLLHPREDRPSDNNSMFKPDENKSLEKPVDLNISIDSSVDLRNDNSINVPKGELMDDVVSKLIGLNNIVPNIKDENKNNTNPKHEDNKNESSPQVPDDKNSSAMWKDNIKNSKNSKVVKKSNNKKSIKKAKKVNKKLPKKSRMGMAKL